MNFIHFVWPHLEASWTGGALKLFRRCWSRNYGREHVLRETRGVSREIRPAVYLNCWTVWMLKCLSWKGGAYLSVLRRNCRVALYKLYHGVSSYLLWPSLSSPSNQASLVINNMSVSPSMPSNKVEQFMESPLVAWVSWICMFGIFGIGGGKLSRGPQKGL